MEKDFNQFGGWLKFFYILFWINVILYCLSIPTEIYIRVLTDNPELVSSTNSFSVVEAMITGIIYWIFTRNMKDRDPKSRNLMMRVAALLVAAIFFLAALQALSSGKVFTDAFEYPNHVLLPLAFFLYLSQSKRVAAYYQLQGEASATVSITREESTAFAQGMVKMFSVTMAAIFVIMLLASLLIYVGQWADKTLAGVM